MLGFTSAIWGLQVLYGVYKCDMGFTSAIWGLQV